MSHKLIVYNILKAGRPGATYTCTSTGTGLDALEGDRADTLDHGDALTRYPSE